MARKLVRLSATLLALLLPAFLAPEARACSCMFGGLSPCQEYWKADAVFVGAVVGESKFTLDEGTYKETMRLVRLAVEQPLRGVEGSEVEVATGWGGGDCGYEFRRGQRYVVYARRGEKDGRLYTGICMRTRPLAEADEDLAYVRGLGSAEPTGTVFGQVFRRNYGRQDGEPAFKPVADAELTVEGGGASRELKTDASGGYRVEGLAAGKYRVTVKVPPGLFYEDGKGERAAVGREVEVAERGCAQSDFHLESDTRVAGRVVDPAGRPVAGLPVQMRGAPGDARNVNNFRYARTDAGGRFEFRAVPPGDYLLGVRILGSAGEAVPYPRTYFPGVVSKEEATVLKVKEGERATGLELRLPAQLSEYEVAGTVVWEDGRPAPGAFVYVSLQEEGGVGGMKPAQADERGRFVLKVYEGQNYRMSAYPRGATGPAAQGEWVDVPPAPGAPPVRLVLPVLKK